MSRPLALVTGAAHRLGRAFALALARRGYDIVLCYHSSAVEAKTTASEIEALGTNAHRIAANLGRPADIAKLFSYVRDVSGELAVLVNSAGVMPRVGAMDVSLQDWDDTIDTNLRAPYFTSQHAARQMSENALIVNISDVGAGRAWSRFPAYTISKAGLEAMTRVLARALAPRVRVNAIAPGLVLPPGSLSDAEWARLIGRLPLRRAGTPEEVTLALEYLLDNQYVTGQTMVVDGGYSLI